LRARVDHARIRIGGLQYEAYDEMEKDVERFCKEFDKRVDDYETLLTSKPHLGGAHEGIGYISAADCIAMGVTGPVLRASGVQWDLRKAKPYAAY